MGSGGGESDFIPGGSGGGAIKPIAGTLTVYGALSANGGLLFCLLGLHRRKLRNLRLQ